MEDIRRYPRRKFNYDRKYSQQKQQDKIKQRNDIAYDVVRGWTKETLSLFGFHQRPLFTIRF
jgi:hypothetical protein